MEIVEKKPSELIPYANNSRTHSDEQVAQICASIREYGFTNPILIEEARGVGTVMREDKPQKADLHPTMKPVALCSRLIRLTSKKGDLVLDPFGGSGSTLIACELLGRRCLSMEYDPRYADVIVRRWEKLTGKKASREDRDGKRGE